VPKHVVRLNIQSYENTQKFYLTENTGIMTSFIQKRDIVNSDPPYLFVMMYHIQLMTQILKKIE